MATVGANCLKSLDTWTNIFCINVFGLNEKIWTQRQQKLLVSSSVCDWQTRIMIGLATCWAAYSCCIQQPKGTQTTDRQPVIWNELKFKYQDAQSTAAYCFSSNDWMNLGWYCNGPKLWNSAECATRRVNVKDDGPSPVSITPFS